MITINNDNNIIDYFQSGYEYSTLNVGSNGKVCINWIGPLKIRRSFAQNSVLDECVIYN